MPPCGDLCFVWDGSAEALAALLDRAGADVVEGPVERQGGRRAAGSSVYVRDPDGNLLEFIDLSGRVEGARVCRLIWSSAGEPSSTGAVRPAGWPTWPISGGVIEEIGPKLDGPVELDASGCAVAPGFIDIHTHFDAQVFWDPELKPSSYHGVTTVVAGNCGFSIAPCRPEHHDVIVHTLENVEGMDADTLTAGIAWDFETFPDYLDLVRRRGTTLNFTVLHRAHRAAALRHGGRGL